MNTVHIMRGCSGSGKSTLARNRFPETVDCTHVAADRFFIEPVIKDGKGGFEYKFDPTKLGEAHAWCMGMFVHAIKEGVETVVVDNTNTKRWEWQNYRDIAKLADYRVEAHVLVPQIEDVHRMWSRNQHGVPISVVAMQAVDLVGNLLIDGVDANETIPVSFD